MKILYWFILLCLTAHAAFSQGRRDLQNLIRDDDNKSSVPVNSSGNNNQFSSTPQYSSPRKDSLAFEHRDDAKDSIKITYKYLDAIAENYIDSSVNDFDKYYPVPSSCQYLGNNGAAAFSLIFKPTTTIGWDAGFHAFDVYRFKPEETKFYKTTRPFTNLNYQLASGKEQMLKAGHTQNRGRQLNFGFDYRLINAPGFFVTQNNNHNNYRIFSNYQGRKKRYNAYLVLVGNTIRASENGGIQNQQDLLDPNRKDRFSVPVNLGNAAPYQTNPFLTKVNTGNIYKDFNFLFRNSYDWGKKDSVAINDSTTEYVFYPKFRIQHTFMNSNQLYRFIDSGADSVLYRKWYDITLKKSTDSFLVNENWNYISNDFSLIQFPDTKNQGQYFLAGVTLQNITGQLTGGKIGKYNLLAHGAYRNSTRNKLWDISLNGSFYWKGFNSGDYSVNASLSRTISRKLGNLQLFFNNSNRTPSFIFDNRSSFNLGNNNNFKKENITSFGVELKGAFAEIGFKNHLIVNYTYFKNYYQSAQYSNLLNIVQAYASKKIKLAKKWSYYLDVVLQQTDLAAPVRVPLLFTRNRLAFEGTLFKNLKLFSGLEARYYTAYKQNNYSPLIGQFTFQNDVTINNRPDVAAFAQFRIKGFAGYIRAENLNTASFQNGFGFINNNFAAPFYPTQGMVIRFGIQWWFVN